MTPVAQCSLCRHFHAGDRTRNACVAFPDGIPEAILLNRSDHRQEFAGDNGVRFEPLLGLPFDHQRLLDQIGAQEADTSMDIA